MDSELGLRDYLDILLRRIGLVLAVFVVFTLLAFLYTALQTPLYRSTTTLLVNQSSAAEIFDPIIGNSQSTRSVENEAEFIRSDTVATAVASKLSGTFDDITVITSRDKDIIRVQATHDDPVSAQTISQTFAETYLELRRTELVNNYLDSAEIIQKRIDAVNASLIEAEAAQNKADQARFEEQRRRLADALDQLEITTQLSGAVGNAQIINPAEVPLQPFSPQTRRTVALGALLGGLLGIATAVVVDSLDRTIKTRADIERAASGLLNLATIPVMEETDTVPPSMVTALTPESQPAEAYRSLRAALQFAAVDRKIKLIQVTSANPSEGKTTTATNLATALAQAGNRVLLVDADLRKPRLHKVFDLKQTPGLTMVIIGSTSQAEATTKLENIRNLSMMPSGPLPPGPSELLGSTASQTAISQIGAEYDYVILDCAPVLPVADSLLIARYVDATVLVATADKTTDAALERCVDLMRQVKAPLIGTVLNRAAERRGLGYGYGYGYGYGVNQPTKRKRFRQRAKATTHTDTDWLHHLDEPSIDLSPKPAHNHTPLASQAPSAPSAPSTAFSSPSAAALFEQKPAFSQPARAQSASENKTPLLDDFDTNAWLQQLDEPSQPLIPQVPTIHATSPVRSAVSATRPAKVSDSESQRDEHGSSIAARSYSGGSDTVLSPTPASADSPVAEKEEAPKQPKTSLRKVYAQKAQSSLDPADTAWADDIKVVVGKAS